MTRSLEFTVYSRRGCHLCELMLAGLRTLQARYAFELRVVDIDADATLYARYNEDIPVLVHGERELCRHQLDPTVIGDYLARCGKLR